MHPNAALLEKLFTALREHKHEVMASCYDPDASFQDIAFDLQGADEIHDMWRMICREETDIKVTFDILEADDHTGRARLVETYRFGATKDPRKPGRPVTNEIESRFTFEKERIKSQIDDCDPKEWANQAIGGIGGLLAGRIAFLRRRKARKKLEKFVEENPG